MIYISRYRLPILLIAMAALAFSLIGQLVWAQEGSAPARPTGLALPDVRHDSVTLTWDDPGDSSITHYQIFRRDRAIHPVGEFVIIENNTGSADTNYTDTTAQPEQGYIYRVKAVNRHGASQWSEYARADTPAALPPSSPGPSPEPTPEGSPTPTATPASSPEPSPEPTPEGSPTPTAKPVVLPLKDLPAPIAKGSTTGGRGDASSAQGAVYTYEDGDRTIRVVLQTDLVVRQTGADTSTNVVVRRVAGGSIVRSHFAYGAAAPPVFRSASGGQLMTLPGGVLLALDPEWDRDRVQRFFSENSISKARISERNFIPNGFFVETEPGFPSLDLANALAAQEGVVFASPNWWQEASTQ